MPRTLISGAREPLQTKLTPPPPTQNGSVEMVNIPPTVTLWPGQPQSFSDQDAEVILDRIGARGIVEVGRMRTKNGWLDLQHETPEQALVRAKQRRLGFLNRMLDRLKQANMTARARGAEIQLPKPYHYAFNEEKKALMQELATTVDAELLGPPTTPTEHFEDLREAELVEFGIPKGVAPAVPGLTDTDW